MEIKGNVIQVLPLQQGTSARTGNPWTIETFILEYGDQFKRKVAIEIFGDENIRKYPVVEGQNVVAFVDAESREFNGRWYTSIRAWKVEDAASVEAASNAPKAAAPVETPDPVQLANMNEGPSDDLPF